MQEACKLIWTRRLEAPGSLSTPTLSNLPHCPISRSGTSSFCHTAILYLQLLSFPFCLSKRVCNCLVQQSRHPFIQEDLRTGPLGSLTCGYDGNMMSAATHVLVQNLCRTSDL